jgi:DNA-binding PadR family transcriptional regulator
MPPPPVDQLPLTVPVYQILLALLDAPMHGYALLQTIEERTQADVRLTASTLYGAVARMLDAGLVTEVRDRDTPRRRSYQITRDGRALVQREAQRLARAVDQARAKRLIGPAKVRTP